MVRPLQDDASDYAASLPFSVNHLLKKSKGLPLDAVKRFLNKYDRCRVSGPHTTTLRCLTKNPNELIDYLDEESPPDEGE